MKTNERLLKMEESKTNGTFETFKKQFENCFLRKDGESFGDTNIFGLHSQGAKPGVYVPFSSTYKRKEMIKKDGKKGRERERLFNIAGGKTFLVKTFIDSTKEKEKKDGTKKTTFGKTPIWGRVINILDLQPLHGGLPEYTATEIQAHEQAQTKFFNSL